MIIDAHAHIGTFNAWPLAKGQPPEIVSTLRNEGIDCALVSSAKAICYDCPSGNAELLEAAAEYEEIIPLLCVNPQRREEAFAELSTWHDRGFVGVKLHPGMHEYSLTCPAAERVLDFCEANSIPLLTHSAEEDTRCGPQAIATIAERHASLALVVGHACLFSSREMVDVAEDHPNVHLELSVNYEAGKLEDTIERLGCDRLLFGSDVPLHHPSVMMQRLRVAQLSRREEDRILFENTRGLYRLSL